MKKFLFVLILLNNCSPALSPLNIGPGLYTGGLDVTIKSKEVLNNSKCKWRCYNENTLSGLEKRLDKLFGQ